MSLCATPLVHEAPAQYFGRNKVEYADFDFRVLATEHFDVYHYPIEAESARLAARLAERWYERFSKALEHTLTGRQPLILYGSQPEFAQTNVVSGLLGEGIGGVTDSARRRITMPFAPTLAETDHILGHEIAHAFQFDMVRRAGGSLTWPLWAVEGMAQYLSLGAVDGDANAWLRDAVQHELLPEERRKAERKFSPYRYGHAFWAYLTGRFGERVIPEVLKMHRGGHIGRRLKHVTEMELDALYADFRAAAREQYGTAAPDADGLERTRLVRDGKSGRMQLGPAISPDGRSVVFFSEKDRVSIDLFQADADRGRVVRKLATTTDSVRLESLQAVRSAGAWSRDGSRFAFAAVDRGRPSLLVIDMRDPDRRREIRLPQLGQVLSPAWSPDGRAVAFSVLHGGITDLYVFDLETEQLRQLTDDPFADLHPAWSPDGARIAFVTERFTSSLDALDFRPTELAMIDLASGGVHRVPVFDGAKHVSPQWSPDGATLYFIADPGGTASVYRLHLATFEVSAIAPLPGVVTGLAATSPALSVAQQADALALTLYRSGKYEVQVLRGQALAGTRVPSLARTSVPPLPPAQRAESAVDALLEPSSASTAGVAMTTKAYVPDMTLEAIGQPYLSSGGGPFGTFVRGGGSFLFGDMLGERKLGAAVQVGNRLRDFAFAVRFLNQEKRLNWGALAELEPALRRVPSRQLTEHDGVDALRFESEYIQRIQGRIAGVLAYPLNRAQRFEFTGGVRHARFLHEVRTRTVSLETGRTISENRSSGSAGEPATMGEVSAAFVGDTSIYGPTGPIMGGRYRFEIAPAIGGLSFTRVHMDYRRYLMPVKPYTIATRIMHMGHYGRDAHDPRLVPTFLGSRYFVRGYNWSEIRCEWAADGSCAALEDMLGSRILVGNLEVRMPLAGMFSRDLTYGPLPIEGFLFADSGVVWSRGRDGMRPTSRRWVNSVGAGVRLNAGGMPFEFGVVRALDAPARGWSFDFGFRTGF